MAATRLETAGNDADTGLLSVHQVAQRLGCSVSLVQKWRRLGWLPATRLGTADVAVYGYRPEDVERFATARWNRRRGRPPKADGAVEDVDRRTAATRRIAAGPAPAGASATGPAIPLGAAATVGSGGAESSPPAGSGRGQAGGAEAAGDRVKADEKAPAGTAAEPEREPPRHQPGHAEWLVQPEFPPVPRDRPLVLWDGDPREEPVLVLARFTPEQDAERVAELWSRRYGTLALGEAKGPDGRPVVYAVWRDGRRESAGR